MIRHRLLSALVGLDIMLFAFISCTNESYDSGDGSLSYLCAEFVEVHTSCDTIIRSATTDAGTELTLSKPVRSSWASVPDSSYRALLYYDKESHPVNVFSLSRVLVLASVPSASSEGIYTDPLSVESIWTSENGRYINLSLLLKTGNADGNTSQQWLSLMVDPEESSDGGLLLLHKQNGVPEYYTSRVYVSIPLSSLPTDKPTTLLVNTYDGKKRYKLK